MGISRDLSVGISGDLQGFVSGDLWTFRDLILYRSLGIFRDLCLRGCRGCLGTFGDLWKICICGNLWGFVWASLDISMDLWLGSLGISRDHFFWASLQTSTNLQGSPEGISRYLLGCLFFRPPFPGYVLHTTFRIGSIYFYSRSGICRDLISGILGIPGNLISGNLWGCSGIFVPGDLQVSLRISGDFWGISSLSLKNLSASLGIFSLALGIYGISGDLLGCPKIHERLCLHRYSEISGNLWW